MENDFVSWKSANQCYTLAHAISLYFLFFSKSIDNRVSHIVIKSSTVTLIAKMGSHNYMCVHADCLKLTQNLHKNEQTNGQRRNEQ